MERNLKRVTVTFSEEMLAKIDAYAFSLGINRSAAVAVLCSTTLQQADTMKTMQGTIDALNSK